MKMTFCRKLILPIALSLGWASGLNADSIDCSNQTTETEAKICNSTELSALAEFADVLGAVVGLEVIYAKPSVNEDVGVSNGVRRLLSSLTLVDIEPLINASQNLAWDFDFDDQHKILFAKAKHGFMQDGVVVFGPTATSASTPLYAEMEFIFDAVRYTYRLAGDVFEIRSTARPAESVRKFRYQDGCWRLIGTDVVWAGYMVEFNDDLAALSTNHLTGRTILDFKEQKDVVRTFDPLVQCLRDRPAFYDIKYHVSDG